MPIGLEQWRAQIALSYASCLPRAIVASKGRKYRRVKWASLFSLCLALVQLLLRAIVDTLDTGQYIKIVSWWKAQLCFSSVFRGNGWRKKGFSLLLTCLMVVQMLLIMAGDVEQNPGPLTGQASRLEISDLVTVQDELVNVTSKWYNVGLGLGLRPGTLNGLQQQWSDPACCSREMLECWLRTVDPPPTWEVLAKALERESVGEQRLAEQLRGKYCIPQERLQQMSHEIQQIEGEIEEIQGETHHRRKRKRTLEEEDDAHDTQHDRLKRQELEFEQEDKNFIDKICVKQRDSLLWTHLSSRDRVRALTSMVHRNNITRKRMQIIGTRTEALTEREKEVKFIVEELEEKAIKLERLQYRLADHKEELERHLGKHAHLAREWNECKRQIDTCNKRLTGIQQELRNITSQIRDIQQQCRDQFIKCQKRLDDCKASVVRCQSDLESCIKILRETIDALYIAIGAFLGAVVGAAGGAAVAGATGGATAMGIGALIGAPLALIVGGVGALVLEQRKREENRRAVERCERELAQCQNAMSECGRILEECDRHLERLLQILQHYHS